VADSADRVKRYPNDLQFRYEYGVVLYEHNRLNEAIEEFQLAQRNPQRRIRTLYYLALCFKQKQQYDIAIEQLQKAASEMTVMDETKKIFCTRWARFAS
jgi:tetratricopeptide (TPR) repeat protein